MQRLPTRREALGLLQITRITQKKKMPKIKKLKKSTNSVCSGKVVFLLF